MERTLLLAARVAQGLRKRWPCYRRVGRGTKPEVMARMHSRLAAIWLCSMAFVAGCSSQPKDPSSNSANVNDTAPYQSTPCLDSDNKNVAIGDCYHDGNGGAWLCVDTSTQGAPNHFVQVAPTTCTFPVTCTDPDGVSLFEGECIHYTDPDYPGPPRLCAANGSGNVSGVLRDVDPSACPSGIVQVCTPLGDDDSSLPYLSGVCSHTQAARCTDDGWVDDADCPR
jgi:hypothetical protein